MRNCQEGEKSQCQHRNPAYNVREQRPGYYVVAEVPGGLDAEDVLEEFPHGVRVRPYISWGSELRNQWGFRVFRPLISNDIRRLEFALILGKDGLYIIFRAFRAINFERHEVVMLSYSSAVTG
jgi:hypothetical protein